MGVTFVPMVKNEHKCHFCDQPIEQGLSVVREDHQFCCTGCATASAMLEGEGLDGPSATLVQKYAHLEAAEASEGLQQYDSTHAQWDVQLPAIHCTSCLILLERMHTWLEGVWDVRVQFSAKSATIRFNPETLPISLLAAWLDFVGYPPSLLAKKEVNRREINRLGVAGFAMGNAMMSAFPEYFGLDQEGFAALLTFFRFSTALFATISLVYAGKSYLSGAYKAVRSAQWSLDIPIALGMIALWSWSAYLLLTGRSGGYFDSLSGLIFFLLIGKWLQGKTYSALSFERTVTDFLPIAVFSEPHQSFVRLEKLQPGTVFQVPFDGIVPVPATLIEPATVDYSFITGETDPQHLQTGASILVGARNAGSTLRARTESAAQTKDIEQLWKDKRDQNTGWVSEKITAIFTLSVLILAASGGLIWAYLDPSRALEIAVSVLIIACPCALSLAAPFAYGTASAVLAKNGLYLKSGRSLAQLSKVKHIFWDKTGTLTAQDASGTLSNPLSNDLLPIFRAGLSRSTHPVSQSLLAALGPGPTSLIQTWSEHPGSGLEFTDELGHLYRVGSGKWLDQPNGPTYLMQDSDVLATFDQTLEYRKTMEPVFAQLQEMGMDHTMISGDRPRTLPETWRPFFDGRTYFEQSPTQKSEKVQPIEGTLFLGDGLNDVEAIESADVGLAVVEDAVGYFPKSDGVVFAQSLPALPQSIRYARQVYKLVKWAYALSLAYNLIGLTFALSGSLSPVVAAILMPISSISVVLFSSLGAHLLRKF